MESKYTCTIPSPYTALPPQCQPLSSCQPTPAQAFPFPILGTCGLSTIDSAEGVCLCQPGEYIAQIYPKVCLQCPSYLYSPNGQNCLVCPPYAEPSMDGTACRCSAGTKDIALTSQDPGCVCRTGMGFSAQNGCYLCAVNTFNAESLTLSSTPWQQSKTCWACAAGTYADTGQSACVSCPNGKYREASMPLCADCS